MHEDGDHCVLTGDGRVWQVSPSDTERAVDEARGCLDGVNRAVGAARLANAERHLVLRAAQRNGVAGFGNTVQG